MKTAEYILQEGDTLFDLGIKFNVPVQELIRLNGENTVKGQKIEIPVSDEVYALYALGMSQGNRFEQTANSESRENDEMGETYRRHKVRRGDTVFLLAKEYGTTVANILAVNPQITDVRNIPAGSIISVPVPPENSYVYAVRPGDTLKSIASAHGTTAENIARYNFISSETPLYAGQQLVLT